MHRGATCSLTHTHPPIRPSFSVILHRTNARGPRYATFSVPLWFNKFDMRDYLYHVYQVRVFGVRSYVEQQRVAQGRPAYVNSGGDGDPRPQPRRWHRPKSKKRMTVELERPFVWPEPPKDFADWNAKTKSSSDAFQRKESEAQGSNTDLMENTDRRTSLKQQARELLEGRARWKPPPIVRQLGPLLRR